MPTGLVSDSGLGKATVMAGRQLILDVFPGLFEVEISMFAARGRDM